MGEEKAIKYWRENKDEFDIILMTNDNRLLVSEGIQSLVMSDRYEVSIIR